MGDINFIVVDDAEKFRELIRQLVHEEPAAYTVSEKDREIEVNDGIRRQVTHMMHELGIPANIQGYNYLRDAILICVTDPDAIHFVTKGLYPQVAAMNKTTSSRVERSIRHAIEVSWIRGNNDLATRLFGYTVDADKGKPTNSEFIALVADKIRMDCKRHRDAS